MGESKCGSNEINFEYASCTDADIANYSWAIDGPQDPGSATYTLKSVQSSLKGTKYDMNADECECDDTMQPTCACAAIEEMMKRKETCSGGDCTPLHMGLFLGILIPCLFCFGFICNKIRRMYLNRARERSQVQTNIFVQPQPQVQMTHHPTHSDGPSVPSMPASYARAQPWTPAQTAASPLGHTYPAPSQPHYPKV